MKRSMLLLPAMLLALASFTPLGAAAPRPPAALAFTPSGSYNFGTLEVGTTASKAFTLTNTGGTASGALAVSLTGSATFTKTADACTGISLGAGKSCSVTVQYSPSGAGASDAAQLNATNGKKKGSTTASVALSGAGAVSERVFVIAYSNLDGTAGYDAGADVLISKLVDGNGNGTPDAGDLVIMGSYPTTATPTGPSDFAAFQITSHTATQASCNVPNGGCNAYVGTTSFHYWWDQLRTETGVNEYGETTQGGGPYVQIFDSLYGYGSDWITAQLGAPSRPSVEVPTTYWPENGDSAFIDVDILWSP